MNDLLRYESDLSDLALREWDGNLKSKLEFERKVGGLACNNIAQNVKRLVKSPKVMTVHLSEIKDAARQFAPDAIVMSGTYADFDYYNPLHIDSFRTFIKGTRIPILAICGAHQLVSIAFDGTLRTLDDLDLKVKRSGRVVEYQYRFVKIVDKSDQSLTASTTRPPAFGRTIPRTTTFCVSGRITAFRSWASPDGFRLLATSYLCKNQMMVKDSDGQLIYTVQFHLEKSFEDWSKNPTRWEHPNESRDGRILFENFLSLALAHGKMD